MRNRMGQVLALTLGLTIALLVVLPGCAYVNAPLNKPQLPKSARAVNATRESMDAPPSPGEPNDDGYFVGLALSGGGSRSANFSAACMFELQKLGILQRVDCISSVSGGSLAAAYYCLNDVNWNPAEVQRRMSHPFATDVIVTVVQPWSMLALMLTPWDRSDILADSFRAHLFSREGRDQLYADLRPDRPRLLINATDLQSGHKFVFCNESFDELNSKLSDYPVAYAVTASAAMPVLLHQVTLRDFSTVQKRYRHVLDGGINDNLGVTTLVETYDQQVQRARSLNRPDPFPHGMVLIVVDAHTNFDTQLDDKPDIGLLDSLAAGADLSTTALLNRVSSATLAQLIVQYSPGNATVQSLRDEIAHLETTGTLVTSDRDGKPVRVVHLALSHLSDMSDLPSATFGQSVNNIATYFNISRDEVYQLYKAAELLVRDEAQANLLNEISRLLNKREVEMK